MHQIVYVSSARRLFSPAELTAILTRSRANNTPLGVTGMLLYKGGNIMQVLEGERETIATLFDRISADARHAGVMILLAEEIPARNFPDWSMGFRDLDDPSVRTLPGYSEFLDTPLAGIRDATKSQKLLAIFRAKM